MNQDEKIKYFLEDKSSSRAFRENCYRRGLSEEQCLEKLKKSAFSSKESLQKTNKPLLEKIKSNLNKLKNL